MMQIKIPEDTYFIESKLYPGSYLSYYGSVLRFLPKREDLSQHWVFKDGILTNMDYKWNLALENYDKFHFNGSHFLSMDRKKALTVYEEAEEKKLKLEDFSTCGEHFLFRPSQIFRIISALLYFPPPPNSKERSEEDREKKDFYLHHTISNPLRGDKYYLHIPFYGDKGFLSHHDVSYGLSVQPLAAPNPSDKQQLWYFQNGTIVNCSTLQYLKFSPCSNSIALVSNIPTSNPWMFDGHNLLISELGHSLQIDGREPSTKFIRLTPASNHDFSMTDLIQRMNTVIHNWCSFLDRNDLSNLKKKELRNIFLNYEEQILLFVREKANDVRDIITHLRKVQDYIFGKLDEKRKNRVETYRLKSENKKRKRETKQIRKQVKNNNRKIKKSSKKNNEKQSSSTTIAKEERKKKEFELKNWLVSIAGMTKSSKKYFKRFRKRRIFVEELPGLSDEDLEVIVDKTSEFRKMKKAIEKLREGNNYSSVPINRVELSDDDEEEEEGEEEEEESDSESSEEEEEESSEDEQSRSEEESED